MRFVKVYHFEEPDFVVGVPDDVPDTDLFLDRVLYGASGWSEAKRTVSAIMDEGFEPGVRTVSQQEDFREYETSVDRVCIGCDYGEETCNTCPVRKTMDRMRKELQNGESIDRA